MAHATQNLSYSKVWFRRVELYKLHQCERTRQMLLLIIILILLFGGGGGYYGYSRWGMGGGLGVVGTILVIVLVLYLLGALR
jgi:hypothetical protein